MTSFMPSPAGMAEMEEERRKRSRGGRGG